MNTALDLSVQYQAVLSSSDPSQAGRFHEERQQEFKLNWVLDALEINEYCVRKAEVESLMQ